MIRAAHLKELAELSALALRSKAVWGYSQDFLDACVEELSVGEEELSGTFVYVEDGVVKGFYTVIRLSQSEAELDLLFVDPKFLRRGIGRHLLVHAIDTARALGCARLKIQGDPNAEGFYEDAGATKVGASPSGSIRGRVLPLYVVEL